MMRPGSRTESSRQCDVRCKVELAYPAINIHTLIIAMSR